MIDKILSALKAEGIEAYTVNETRTESAEAFFVRRSMDLKRRTTLTDYNVTVFRTIEKENTRLLGSSAVPVYPGMGEAELRRTLHDAWFAAGLAGNEYYDLLAGEREPFVPSESGFAGMELEQALKLMGDAIFSADTCEDVFVNSAELFALRRRDRVLNSRGVDVSWETLEVNGEYVIQCPAPQDVETYHHFAYREPDAAALRQDVEQSLARTRDRAAAVRPPKSGEYTVILSEQSMAELFRYYVTRASAGLVYQHYSDYAVGKNVQGEDVRGDKLSIDLMPTAPYDAEGIALRDRPLLEDGVVRTIHGGARYASYLGLEPTGAYRGIRVRSGETPLAELKRQPYLHVVTFSDFQTNLFSGHFAGEIRLGYLFDGDTVTPVTGGSINGDLLAAQKDMRLSRERYVTSSYDGPLAAALPGVRVAGAE